MIFSGLARDFVLVCEGTAKLSPLKVRIGKAAVYGIDPPKSAHLGQVYKFNGSWNCIPRVLHLRVLFGNSDSLHLQT